MADLRDMVSLDWPSFDWGRLERLFGSGLTPDILSPDILNYAIPGFVLLIAIEMLVARKRDATRYCVRDTLTSLLLGFGSTVAGALAAGALYLMAERIHGLSPINIGYAWWAWLACLLLDDFAYYLFHRSAHRVRWFWASHVVHHSSQHYNLSTALRQTWTGNLSLAFLFRLPLALIFPAPMLFFCAGINLIYQFWIHTEMVGRMPRWFEAVMNTPSHHRVHHAVNPRYLDRNYAGMLIVWDRMFGTFQRERADDRPRYGLVTQIASFNPLWAAFHEWIAIARDLWNAPGLAAWWGYIARPPGWSHDGSRDTSDTIRARWSARQAPEEHKATLLPEAGNDPHWGDEHHPAAAGSRASASR